MAGAILRNLPEKIAKMPGEKIVTHYILEGVFK
jgi:hypothetical protein